MRLMLCALVLLFGASTFAGDDGPNGAERAAAQKALAVLQPLVGPWKGVGQPQRGSTSGAWSETADYAWAFEKSSAAVVFNAKASKLYESGRIERGAGEGELLLTLKSIDGENFKLVGKATAADRFEFKSERPGAGPVAVSLRLVANGDRLLLLAQKQAPGANTLTRIAEIGYTRVGGGFGQAGEGPECVVTGGAALIAVMHKGKRYYVCCTGCKDYFESDPEEVLAAYEERLAERAKKK